MTARGYFIVLDGVDGAGKSSQAARLERRLAAAGATPLSVREPGSTAAGEALRELLLHKEFGLVPAAETLLFVAARRQLLEQRIAPALAAGQVVICDRFNASTFAYQAYARGGDQDGTLALLENWATTPTPDLELVLWLDPAAAAVRRGAPADRIEALGLGFQQRVAAGYREYVQRVPRAELIDASGDLDAVETRLWRALAQRLGGPFARHLEGQPWS
jgi:dTMP kinase